MVQEAWLKLDVPQCGYCQAGQIMAATALLEAGFQPSAAQQTRSRSGSDPTYARHMIRLRRTCESLTLVDCIPEICLINAHDGTLSLIHI